MFPKETTEDKEINILSNDDHNQNQGPQMDMPPKLETQIMKNNGYNDDLKVITSNIEKEDREITTSKNAIEYVHQKDANRSLEKITLIEDNLEESILSDEHNSSHEIISDDTFRSVCKDVRNTEILPDAKKVMANNGHDDDLGEVTSSDSNNDNSGINKKDAAMLITQETDQFRLENGVKFKKKITEKNGNDDLEVVTSNSNNGKSCIDKEEAAMFATQEVNQICNQNRIIFEKPCAKINTKSDTMDITNIPDSMDTSKPNAEVNTIDIVDEPDSSDASKILIEDNINESIHEDNQSCNIVSDEEVGEINKDVSNTESLTGEKIICDSNEKSLECQLCEEEIAEEADTVSCSKVPNPYVVLKHSIFPCHVVGCTKIFTTLPERNLHVKLHGFKNIKHIQSVKVVLIREVIHCDKCNKGFLNSGEYRVHRLKHIQTLVCNKIRSSEPVDRVRFAKRFKCEQCDMCFVQESTLLAHADVHRPFYHVCFCGIGFHKLKDLVGHKKLVHPESLIKIEVPAIKIEPKHNDVETKINKKINTVTSIRKKQVKTNSTKTNNKYECDICHKLLHSGPNLKNHLRLHTGEKPYKCKQCKRSFTSTITLKTHSVIHSGAEPYECDMCDKKFYFIDRLVRHRRCHTGEKPYKCEFCKKSFSDPSAFKRHIRIHTKETLYQCKYCPKAFGDAGAYRRHEWFHEGRKDFNCAICDKSFAAKETLKKHVKLHFQDLRQKNIKCDVCDKMFYEKSNMIQHIEYFHKKRRVECDYCGLKLYHKHQIARHIIKNHMGSAKCEVCEKYFHNSTAFKDHLGTCKPKEIYECPKCPKTFRSKYTLQSHLAVHAPGYKTKDYECDHCGEKFSNKVRIAEHIFKVHTHHLYCSKCNRAYSTDEALKRHQKYCASATLNCDICGLWFNHRKMYEKHLAFHTNNKCDFCDRRFSRRRALTTHVRRVHAKEQT